MRLDIPFAQQYFHIVNTITKKIVLLYNEKLFRL